MQTDPKRVDWGSWLRSRPRDIHRPDKMIVQLGGSWHCLLCERRVSGARAEHHLAHMLELDDYQAGASAAPTPNMLRAERRREQRRQGIERAEMFGRDPHLYAVERVEKVAPNNPHDHRVRPVVRRRLRHPKAETLARVRSILTEIGAKTPAGPLVVTRVAEQLQVTENYARRIIREIEVSDG